MTTRRICKRSLALSIIFNDIISIIDSLDNVQRPRPITGINHGQGGFLPKENHPLGIRQDGNTLNKWLKHTEEKVNSIAIRPANIQTSQSRWIQILQVQLTTSKSYSNTPPEGTGTHRGRCLNHRLIEASSMVPQQWPNPWVPPMIHLSIFLAPQLLCTITCIISIIGDGCFSPAFGHYKTMLYYDRQPVLLKSRITWLVSTM